jgi:hypothetical protein
MKRCSPSLDRFDWRPRERIDGPARRAIRDAQARWAREQPLITSESVIRVVQGARATIIHAGAAEARGARRT